MPRTLDDAPDTESDAPAAERFRAVVGEALSQDIIMAADVHVDRDSAAPVAVFRNPFCGAKGGPAPHEALVISKVGGATALLHVAPDPASPSGWSATEPFTSEHRPTEVVVIARTEGPSPYVWCFFVAGGNAYRSWLTDAKTWHAPQHVGPRDMDVKALKVSYLDNDAVGRHERLEPVVTAAASSGGYVLGPMKPVPVPVKLGADSQFAYLGARRWVAALVDDDGHLMTSWGHLGGEGGRSRRVEEVRGGSFKRVVAAFARPHGAVFLVQNWNDTLFMWQCDREANTLSVELLGPVVLSRPAAHVSGTQHTGMLPWDLYGVDGKNRLWALRQNPETPHDTHGAPKWMPPLPLDTGITGVAISAEPADAPTLFSWAEDRPGLRMETQDAHTGLWREVAVRTPQNNVYELTHYRVQVTVTNVTGAPAARKKLTLRCGEKASACTVLVQNRVVPLGREGVELTTDAFGKLTFGVTPDGLGSSVLELSGGGLDRVVIQPGHAVHTYLSGTGTLRETDPDGSLPKFTKDGSALRDARKRGPEGGALAPRAQDEQLATIAAQAIQHTALVGLGKPLTEGAAGFRVTMPSDPDGKAVAAPGAHRFVLLRTAQDVEEHRADLRRRVAGTEGTEEEYGWAPFDWVRDKWNDLVDGVKHLTKEVYRKLTQYGGDLMRGIKSGLITLEDAVLDGTKKISEIAVRIGTQIVKGLKIALHGLEQAAQFVVAVFHKLQALIQQVIDWLKALFDLPAIWRTKNALEEAIKGMVPLMRGGVERARSKADDWLDQQRGKVEESLGGIGRNEHGRTQLGSVPGWDDAMKVVQAGGSLHANWILDKLLHAGGVDLPNRTQDDAVEAAVLKLDRKVSEIGNEFFRATDHIMGVLKDLGSHEAFGKQTLEDLAKACAPTLEVFLGTAKAALDSFAELLTASLDAFERVLTGEIGGVLDSIWKWICKLIGKEGSRLTLAGFSALLAALPVTFGYKIARGDSKAEPFPKGRLPSFLSGGSDGTDPDGVDSSNPFGAMALVAGLLQAISLIPALSGDVLGDEAPGWLAGVGIAWAGVIFLLAHASMEAGAWKSLTDLGVLWTVFAGVIGTAIIGVVIAAVVKYWDKRKTLGPILLSVFGGVSLIVAAIQVGRDKVKGAGPVTSALMSPFAPLTAFLNHPRCRSDYTIPIKCVIDAVCNAVPGTLVAMEASRPGGVASA